MRRLLVYHLLFFLLTGLNVYAQYNPQKDLGDLFIQVQMNRAFPDSKIFPDCIPIYPVDTIKKHYEKEKNKPGFELKSFVISNFNLPKPVKYIRNDTFPGIKTHINTLWGSLVRYKPVSSGSLIGLPHPYVVPGGRFNEIYYWDSYFTMLGLKVSGKTDLIQNMTDDFAYLIQRFGFIPNGNRTYYLTRSQPPFFSMMVELLAGIKGDTIYVHYLPEMLAEYHFWMEGSGKLNPKQAAFKRVVFLNNGMIMNRYWDNDSTPRAEAYREDVGIAAMSGKSPGKVYRNIRAACESGWDFSSRWFGDGVSLSAIRTTDIIPVDLNCLLYHLEMCIAKSFQLKGEMKSGSFYLSKAEVRKKAMLRYCWDKEKGFFIDYDFEKHQPSGVLSLAGMFPLYFQLSDNSQARLVADKIQKYFLRPGGLLTTLMLTGQQWDAPNGWAPLQWISYQALKNYGYKALSDTLRHRWIIVIKDNYKKAGKLLEKYNVLYPEIPGGGGEYPSQDGFGWTNGVFLKMLSEKE